MSLSRAQRRAMRSCAEVNAVRLAGSCYDLQGSGLVAVRNPKAIAALRRAFLILLKSGGEPVAVVLAAADAMAFPRPATCCAAGGVTWLAVGLDPDGRGSYALQSACVDDGPTASHAARSIALSRLAGMTATRGFPIGSARGHA